MERVFKNPNLRTVRRLENRTQAWLGKQVGVFDTVIYQQENNQDGTAYGRIVQMFDILGYDIIAVKREEEK